MEGTQAAETVLVPAPLTLRLVQVAQPQLWLSRVAPIAGMAVIYLVLSRMGNWSLREQPLLLLLLGSVALISSLIKKAFPEAGLDTVGTLTCASDAVYVQFGDDPVQQFSLADARARVVITYQGYRDEQLDSRHHATGFANFIAVNGGPPHRFLVIMAEECEHLRALIRGWYLQKVRVKEYRDDGPTFLLHRNLSYEQIQAYKREFGVSLY